MSSRIVNLTGGSLPHVSLSSVVRTWIRLEESLRIILSCCGGASTSDSTASGSSDDDEPAALDDQDDSSAGPGVATSWPDRVTSGWNRPAWISETVCARTRKGPAKESRE